VNLTGKNTIIKGTALFAQGALAQNYLAFPWSDRLSRKEISFASFPRIKPPEGPLTDLTSPALLNF
jgi:hypothetical protein